tara:strand:- start:157 stop:771 length:615 start_codon:yes stop_codon:yes gene_type:complete
MCFHFNFHQTAEKVSERFQAEYKQGELLTPAHFNGFSFPQTPVILDEKPQLIQPINWGLIPFWAKDKSIQKYALNAKIETLTEKPSFRNSVNKRCLIIANSFWEWQWLDPKGKNKQKYEISKADDELFAFGGIWAEWTNKTTGEIIKSYSIITTAANDLMAKIHNTKKRMPLILNREEELTWLNGSDFSDFKERAVNLIAVEAY